MLGVNSIRLKVQIVKPVKSKDLVELLACAAGKMDFILGPHFLARAGSMVMYGESESGKSWLVLYLCFCIVTGTNWLGYPVKQGRVLVIQGEQSETNYAERVLDFVRAHGYNPNELRSKLRFINHTGLRLDTHQGWQYVKSEVEAFRPDVVVFDCMYQFVKNTADPVSMGVYTDGCSGLQDVYGCATVTIHHPRKGDKDGVDMSKDEMSGMASLNWWVDTLVRLYRKDGGNVLTLNWQKQKHAKIRVNAPVLVQKAGLNFSLFNGGNNAE